jgi:hypothetical protein
MTATQIRLRRTLLSFINCPRFEHQLSLKDNVVKFMHLLARQPPAFVQVCLKYSTAENTRSRRLVPTALYDGVVRMNSFDWLQF